MKLIFTALLLSFISIQSFAQAPAIKWQKSLGGTETDYGLCIRATPDGGYITAGISSSFNGQVTGNHGGTYDCWVVKLDDTGGIQWEKSLGGNGTDQAEWIEQTADGGYIVGGTTNSTDGDVTGNHGGNEMWAVKLNDTGGIQWQKCLGGNNEEDLSFIQQTFEGGYVVTGLTGSNNGDVSGKHGGYDCWLAKTNTIGAVQWQKCLGGSADDIGYCVRQTPDSGYIVAGASGSTDGDITDHHGAGGLFDFWIVKLNDTGIIQWKKSYGGSQNDFAYSLQQTKDKGFVVAGYSMSNDGDVTGNHGDQDFWVLKIDSVGTIQWQRSLGGSGKDLAQSVQQTLDGGYIVAGMSNSTDGDVTGGHGDFDYWIVKLDSTGVLQWQKTFGGLITDKSFAIQQTLAGNYIVAGYSRSSDGDITGNHGSYDYWIVNLSCGFEGNTITGASSFCQGSTLTLTDTVAGGVWGTSNGHATVAGGVVTGATPGVDTIAYTIINTCGSSFASTVVTVNPLPDAGNIVGPAIACLDSVTVYTNAVTGGVWSGTNVHSVLVGGNLYAVSQGIDTISYMVTSPCGTDTAILTINILHCPVRVSSLNGNSSIALVPNPTTGNIYVVGATNVTLRVSNALGQQIKQTMNTGAISIAEFPAGIYFAQVLDEQGNVLLQEKIIKE